MEEGISVVNHHHVSLGVLDRRYVSDPQPKGVKPRVVSSPKPASPKQISVLLLCLVIALILTVIFEMWI